MSLRCENGKGIYYLFIIQKGSRVEVREHCGNHFSPSDPWIPRIKLRLSDLAVSTYACQDIAQGDSTSAL